MGTYPSIRVLRRGVPRGAAVASFLSAEGDFSRLRARVGPLNLGRSALAHATLRSQAAHPRKQLSCACALRREPLASKEADSLVLAPPLIDQFSTISLAVQMEPSLRIFNFLEQSVAFFFSDSRVWNSTVVYTSVFQVFFGCVFIAKFTGIEKAAPLFFGASFFFFE